ncbi:uncharacterized protein LOC114556718 [Perca flavescens]|uniref:uncharacterized protein LOC114556718 n=1 Tax=Perca flavescens TaxID=8167 RepID=UPI00106DEA99|nr:uncharacterized protein LOC114556718 [Perca flavescens]
MEEFSDFSIPLSCHSGISPAADSRTHLSPVIQINMKISIFAGVLLISAALTFLGPEPADAQFNNKRINAGMTDDQCTQEIKDKNPINGCKGTNTFITEKVKHDVAWFTNQHIAEKMNEDDCTNVIKGRGIMKDNGSCKWSNTFIIASLEAVAAVCKTTQPVKPNSNIHQSTTTFDLIDCTQTMDSAKDKDKPPNCVYKKGEVLDKKIIVIGCDKYGPVHFETFL